MASNNSNKHLTLEERQIIETGISNGSTKVAIALTLGKDKSTIGKEIKLHRVLSKKMNLALECANYKICKLGRNCKSTCGNYKPFKCTRRDRSPGACNGCPTINGCRFNHYMYHASEANFDYRLQLVNSRIGLNIDQDELFRIGNIIEPLIKKGLSPYVVLQAHPEINLSEKTLYNYIESNAFKNAGVNLGSLDLRAQVRRRIKKKVSNTYKKRKDSKYLKGRLYDDYQAFIDENPNASVVEMDTVYNDISNGPFMQTFKFMKYGFMFIIYRNEKTFLSMYDGILFLESILGDELFNKEVQVILTDRGTAFVMANEIEVREDGTRRTRIFYCDPMASRQKGSLEQNHKEIRYITPKGVNLTALGLTNQSAANLMTSHINSVPKEKLNGKSPIELMEFLNPAMVKKFYDSGISKISVNEIVLKPHLLKK